MNAKYQIEIKEFEEHFGKFKNRKIVLYGIGRYTATLVEGLHDFQIIGLMDKDPENIGKNVFGLPVIDIHTAEKIADMLIINTSETYWNVIHNRIEGIRIPVYYKNGVRAKKNEKRRLINPYRELNTISLSQQMEKAEVISFDFFDTLFMRSVCNPRDVFCFLEQDIRDCWTAEKSFIETRSDAMKGLQENYSLDELYENIEKISRLPHTIIEEIKENELILEKKFLFPRTEILQLFIRVLESSKEIYIISDMYLPKIFYTKVFMEYDINFPESHILLSNIFNKSKSDGSLWEYYTNEIVKGRTALHMGDHKQADMEEPQNYGVQTYLVPSSWELMQISSMSEVGAHICTDYDTALAGCILKKMFRNPYTLYHCDGFIEIKSNEDMGYMIFGPVILTFLLWLNQQAKEDKISRFIFMSRDGYFLKEDYEYLCKLTDEEPHCCYIAISRQLAMSASITTKEELFEYAFMPYTGGITELFEDRFGIKGVKEIPGQSLEYYLDIYNSEIRQKLSVIRNHYLHYLNKIKPDEQSAVVDLGFYGNNQRYLNKLTGRNLRGYYFNANLSQQNENATNQQMKACFQKKHDLTGKESQILNHMIFIESVLTAPYGMIKAIDEEGNFICAEKKQNQMCFHKKTEINEGIKKFIRDYIKQFRNYDIQLHTEFTDWYYGYCMNGALKIADHVKQSFYNDNAMMNRIESMLFY